MSTERGMADEYRIKRSGDVCAACGREFALGETLVSTIALAEHEPQRQDTCVACAANATHDPEREVAHWRTKKTELGRAKRKVDFPALRDLFVRMLSCNGSEYGKLSYLLGLVLLRKRALKLHEFITDGGQDWLVVSVTPVTSESERFRLIAPELRTEEIAELRERLKLLLDVDVNPEEGIELPAGDAGTAEA